MTSFSGFRPVVIKDVEKLSSKLRMLIDLQLLSIYRDLRNHLPRMNGVVLDVGCGQQPYRRLLPPDCRYVAIDIPSGFDMEHSNCAFFDGLTFPIQTASCDAVISVEVLEHVNDLKQHVSEIHRVLVHGGVLLLTTPWSARMHYMPHDYRRLSRYGLADLLERFGFETLSISPRGNIFSVISNKLLVKILEPLNSRKIVTRCLVLTGRALLLPMLLVTHTVALICLVCRIDDEIDPLGWTAIARKR